MSQAYQLLPIAIPILFIVHFRYAHSAEDTAEAETEVVFSTREIDLSRKRVGSFAMGTETLTLVAPATKLNGDENSIVPGPGRRIGRKLLGGALLGAMSATAGFGLGSAVDGQYCRDDDAEEPFCVEDTAVLGAFIGCAVGPAIGVSAMDPYDRFAYSLAGSLAGALLGGGLAGGIWYLYPIFIIGSSTALATLGSELSRNRRKGPNSPSPRPSNVTIRFEPDLIGGLSATVNLRF